MTITVTVASWNLRNYRTTGAFDEPYPHRKRVAGVIRELGADVVLVQGLFSPRDPQGADGVLRQLATDTGLDCYAEPQWRGGDASAGTIAAAPAATGFGTGIMWDRGFTPVSGTWETEDRNSAGLWHAMASITLTGDAGPLHVASFHADPFDPARRIAEAHQVRRIIAGHTDPAIVGGDWNAVSANRFTDPDPYYPGHWHDELVHQVHLTTDEAGRPVSWPADRRPAEILAAGGLRDPAMNYRIGTDPLAPTTGHDPADPYPPRRIDRFLANRRAAANVVDYQVHDTPDARTCSAHLPVSISLQTFGP